MLQVNVAQFLIHSLSDGIADNNEPFVSQTIDMLVDSWSNQKYLHIKPMFDGHANHRLS